MTLRFAFVTDPQLGCMSTFSGSDDAACERFAQRGMLVRPFPETSSIEWDVDRWESTVDAVASCGADFVMVGGDMVESIDRPDQLEAYRAAIAPWDDTPVHHVPGNHDICADKVIPTEDSIEWYRTHFGHEHVAFTHPCDGPDDDARATFIVVNSPSLQQPRRVPGSDDDELAFLEQELDAARGRGGPIVVFSHHPPYLEDPDEPDNYWNLPARSRHQLLELCVEHGVSCLFAGHRHLNDHADHHGLGIVTSAASGFPLGVDPPGYRIVDVDSGGLRHAYHPLSDPGWSSIGGPPCSDTPEPIQPIS